MLVATQLPVSRAICTNTGCYVLQIVRLSTPLDVAESYRIVLSFIDIDSLNAVGASMGSRLKQSRAVVPPEDPLAIVWLNRLLLLVSIFKVPGSVNLFSLVKYILQDIHMEAF